MHNDTCPDAVYGYGDLSAYICDRVWETRAQDYKEKHKLDSKQISDSAFGAHLSFCQK